MEADRVARVADAAVELRQSHREALRLVGLRRGEEPEDAVVEPGLGARPIDVSEVRLAVDGGRRADGVPLELGEEPLPPGERAA
jgi:hypothetical protein